MQHMSTTDGHTDEQNCNYFHSIVR